MTIDIALLSTTIVSTFLIPYAKLGLEKLAESIGENVGKSAAEHASTTTQKIWNRIKALFNSEDEQVVISQFEKRPDATKTLIEEILKEKLTKNTVLAEELATLINNPDPNGGNTSIEIMNAGIAGVIDARGANFSGASGINISGVTIDKPSSNPSTNK